MLVAMLDYSDENILNKVSLCCLNNTTISHEVYLYILLNKNSVKYL